MDKNIPIGIDDFKKLTQKENNYLFIDKSLFIKDVIDDKSLVSLITRPRRWGKTLNMSMLAYFLSIEDAGLMQGVFSELEIAKVDNGSYLKHQGQYPVILVSFKDVKEKTFELTLAKLKFLIQNLFASHANSLSNSDKLNDYEKSLFARYVQGEINKAELEGSLFTLSQLLYKHYDKKAVYILVDEYDTSLNYAYSSDFMDDMTAFMKNLLGMALKGNSYLEKGVMTGILRISKDSMLSDLNNVKVFSVVDDRYAQHFGFKEQEVCDLFSQCGLAQNLEKVRQYYNGYCVGDVMLYNPWSIINCIDGRGKLIAYWVNTASDEVLKELLLRSAPTLKEQFQNLLLNPESVVDTPVSEAIRFDELETDDSALWSLLLAMGYLTIRSKRIADMYYACELTVPNQEIRTLYIKIFKGWFRHVLKTSVYVEFMEDLTAGRVDDFTRKLEDYLMIYGTGHEFTYESNYHTFMLGLLCGFTDYYALYSNAPSGLGRSDLMLVPLKDDSFAIILEFKHAKDKAVDEALAVAALEQIDTLRYTTFLGRYKSIKQVLKIGIVFANRTAISRYRWEILS